MFIDNNQFISGYIDDSVQQVEKPVCTKRKYFEENSPIANKSILNKKQKIGKENVINFTPIAEGNDRQLFKVGPLTSEKEVVNIANAVINQNREPFIKLRGCGLSLTHERLYKNEKKLIGNGEFKITYQATSISLKNEEKKPIACLKVDDKVIKTDLILNIYESEDGKEKVYSDFSDISSLDLSLKEVEIQKSFDHPNIVKIFDFHVYDRKDSSTKRLAIYAEKCDETLQKAILEKKLSFNQKIKIIRGIASAVAYIHSKGFTYNDLKPDNILLLGNEGKLTDFGTCVEIGKRAPLLCLRTLTPEARGKTEEMRSLKSTLRNKIDKLKEITPEEARKYQQSLEHLKSDPSTDVYHFGIVLWHLFDPNQKKEYFDNCSTSFRTILENKEERFKGWENTALMQLIDDCLNPDPTKRPTMQEVDARLGLIN